MLHVVFLCLTFAAPSLPQTNARETLRGLSGVPVKVTYVRGAGRGDVAGLKTFVELRLRRSGVRIFDQPRRVDGRALLAVTVIVDGEGSLIFLETMLRQEVSIKRTPTVTAYPATWEATALNGAPEATDAVVREEVGKQIDNFINDFLAVNPQ